MEGRVAQQSPLKTVSGGEQNMLYCRRWVVDGILCLSSPSPRLQLLLLTQPLGCLTSLVNKRSKFIPFTTKAHAEVGLVL